MSVREYIGARYIPVFADPIQWDPTLKYEPLTVVTNEGASYVSRRYVPEGIQLDNTDYWVLWADFNAQLQHYIDEVQTFDGRIDTLEDKFPLETIDIADGAVTSAKIADGTIATADIADGAVTSAKLSDSLQATVNSLANSEMVVFGDSWTTDIRAWMTYYSNAKRYSSFTTYGITGAAFITRDYNTVASQLVTAAADSSVNKNYVKEVIIIAGVNDYRDNPTFTVNDFISEVISVMDNAATLYPNAHVRYFFNCQCEGVTDSFYRQFAYIFNRGHDVDTLLPCLWMLDAAYGTDHLHLNNTGERLLTTYLLNQRVIPFTTSTIIDPADIVSSNPNITVSDFTIYRKQSAIGIQFNVVCNASNSEGNISLPSPFDGIFFNRQNSIMMTYVGGASGGSPNSFGFSGNNKLVCARLAVSTNYIAMECIPPWI